MQNFSSLFLSVLSKRDVVKWQKVKTHSTRLSCRSLFRSWTTTKSWAHLNIYAINFYRERSYIVSKGESYHLAAALYQSNNFSPPPVIWSASVNLSYGNHGLPIIQSILTLMNTWILQQQSRFVSVLLLYHC